MNEIDLARKALWEAEKYSLNSKDPRTKVGACTLKKDGSLYSLGCNQLPKNVDFTDEEWMDREFKYNYIIHAELDCLKKIVPGNAGLIAVTLLPCKECIKLISAYEIPRVYYRDIWEVSNCFDTAKRMKIELIRLT